jgi:hypothetical protein
MDTDGQFYLGKLFDQKQGKLSDQPLLYDPDDLTTHAFVVGMTGSGKTGLCVGLLEEAALNGLPALMIDPKGDITNLLLHFPDLLPQDFQPWINPDMARRDKQTLEQAAAQTAESWRKGLADWGITRERIQALKDAAHFAVYTPGSDAGIPVSILASLKAPQIPWGENRELLREKISGTVTALLGLVGLNDIDPVRSREHILLANIFEDAWKNGRDLQLDELILQTQNPPFQKLGVFDVNTFFPEKDRFGLAMILNNILAAPAFQTWIEGEPLDIPSLLYGPDGRPRHSVFYIAHLSDAERMFFVTLLFSAVEAWMRTQSGVTSLRSLVYFDEIFGYMPPIGNPPSKQPMLRMLKQARAFGVGLVLVTQNPVDVDYKGLSNTGTWFIGKLQTERDKQRLLDGLEGALAGALDRQAYDRLIAGLGKRVFLMHNVHNTEPLLFGTRWAINYLAGPLTRTQIPALNALADAKEAPGLPGTIPFAPQPASNAAASERPTQPLRPAAKPAARPPAEPVAAAETAAGTSTTRPPIPAGVAEVFLPNNRTVGEAYKAAGQTAPAGASHAELVYRPALLAQARLRFLNRKYNLDYEQVRAVRVPSPDRRGVVRWDEYTAETVDPRRLDQRPAPGARFTILEAPFNDVKTLKTLEKDFVDWAYRSGAITLRANEALKLYAEPDTSQAEFRQRCAEAARKGRDQEAQKVAAAFEKKLSVLQEKLRREARELNEDQEELSQRKLEEYGTHAENIFGLFGGRKSTRRLSSSLSKRRMTAQAKADVEESQDAIGDLEKQVAALEKEQAHALEEVNRRWGDIANQISEVTVAALKKDVLIDIFGVAWVPYYVLDGDELLATE